MKKINIAIDGPSAAGKSTLAKAIAKELGYVHLDTGAMYRCTAYKAKQSNIDWEDESALVSMLKTTSIELTPQGLVILDGIDVSSEIRQNEISLGASHVSKHAEVRKELVRRQQEMAKQKGFVMDGRDIGTVVLPEAEVKIFQTASAKTRAMRRYKENLSKGIPSDLDKLEEEIKQRDINDSTRAASPLKQAEDAILFDTSDLTETEAVESMLKHIYSILN